MPPDDEAFGSSSLERGLKLVAQIGSPVALATALLFYFGWVRADAQANALGYDVSLLALSPADFVLRSVNVLFFPLIVVIIGAIALVVAEPRLITRLSKLRPGQQRRVHSFLRLFWLWAGVLPGIAAYALMPAARRVVIPAALSVALLLTLYRHRLDRMLLDQRPPPILRGLVLALLCVVVFWDVERVASALGRGFAADIIDRPTRFASVTVFSAKSLEIRTPNTVATRISADTSAYAYRYQGLRLMLYANSKYVLFDTIRAQRRAVIVVLPDQGDIRVEFARR